MIETEFHLARLEQWGATRKRRSKMLRRLRRNPSSLTFWLAGMPDDVPRNCQHCGELFIPDAARLADSYPMPPSVLTLHTRGFCSSYCAGSTPAPIPADLLPLDKTLRGKRLSTAVFERDRWTCYLCGRPTPPDIGGHQPNSPTVDHVIPRGNGTEEPDNLRCACRRCNTEKGASSVWQKVSPIVAHHYWAEETVSWLSPPLAAEDLPSFWRYYVFNGDCEPEWWNAPAHPRLTKLPDAECKPLPPPITRLVIMAVD